MTTRKFLVPVDDMSYRWALLVEINAERLNWARRALAAFERMKKEPDLPLEEIRYDWGANSAQLIQDAGLDEDTADAVFYDKSTIMLGTDLDPGTYRTVELRGSLTLGVDDKGLHWSGAVKEGPFHTWHGLSWVELGIDTEDLLRCRYHDCVEAHPVAGENDLVTCHTCRRFMCLPVEDEEEARE